MYFTGNVMRLDSTETNVSSVLVIGVYPLNKWNKQVIIFYFFYQLIERGFNKTETFKPKLFAVVFICSR